MPIRRTFVRASVLLLFSSLCWPQEFRATISGRVIDSQGAAVPSTDGQFALAFLTPGLQAVSAEASGFKRYVRTGLQVRTDERMTLDIALDLDGLLVYHCESEQQHNSFESTCRKFRIPQTSQICLFAALVPEVVIF